MSGGGGGGDGGGGGGNINSGSGRKRDDRELMVVVVATVAVVLMSSTESSIETGNDGHKKMAISNLAKGTGGLHILSRTHEQRAIGKTLSSSPALSIDCSAVSYLSDRHTMTESGNCIERRRPNSMQGCCSCDCNSTGIARGWHL